MVKLGNVAVSILVAGVVHCRFSSRHGLEVHKAEFHGGVTLGQSFSLSNLPYKVVVKMK